jgi:hypothetical protein
MSRRSERMLHAFGLDLMVIEPVYRERMPYDDSEFRFTLIERQGLMVIGTMYKEGYLKS